MCIFFKPEWQHVIYLLCTWLFTEKEILSSSIVGILQTMFCGKGRRVLNCIHLLLSLFPSQTSTPGRGTSKQKNAPWGPTLRLLTAAGMTDPRTLNSHLWITACRVCWGRGWICLRISTIHMRSGWKERCFHNPSVGKSCSRITKLWSTKHLIDRGWLQ